MLECHLAVIGNSQSVNLTYQEFLVIKSLSQSWMYFPPRIYQLWFECHLPLYQNLRNEKPREDENLLQKFWSNVPRLWLKQLYSIVGSYNNTMDATNKPCESVKTIREI